jgi:hypothetical protein
MILIFSYLNINMATDPFSHTPKQMGGRLITLLYPRGANRPKPASDPVPRFSCLKWELKVHDLGEVGGWRTFLPRFQYTIRDLKSGILALGFSTVFEDLHIEAMSQYLFKNLKGSFSTAQLVVKEGIEPIHLAYPLMEKRLYSYLKCSSRRGFLEQIENYRMFYNCAHKFFEMSRQTPWFIAQIDHPNKKIIDLIHALKVVDLDHYAQG